MVQSIAAMDYHTKHSITQNIGALIGYLQKVALYKQIIMQMFIRDF